jgi:hypothetical protein
MGFVEREGRANTRSVRLDKALNEELEKEADKQGDSVSNLVGRIVERYLNHYRWTERINCLTIPPITLESFLELLDEESLAKIGDKLGSSVPKQDFMMRGVTIDEESAKLLIMKMLGEYDNWFLVSYHNSSKPYFFIRNRLGDKWITFVEAYIRAFYQEALGLELECERVGSNLQLIIPDKDET